jgi:hypothetical protein
MHHYVLRRSLTSVFIRHMYSPMIPSISICTPPKNSIVIIKEGSPFAIPKTSLSNSTMIAHEANSRDDQAKIGA